MATDIENLPGHIAFEKFAPATYRIFAQSFWLITPFRLTIGKRLDWAESKHCDAYFCHNISV